MKTINDIIELQFKAAGDTQHINNFKDKSVFIVSKLWLRNLVKITIEETANLCAENAEMTGIAYGNDKSISDYEVSKGSILRVKELIK